MIYKTLGYFIQKLDIAGKVPKNLFTLVIHFIEWKIKYRKNMNWRWKLAQYAEIRWWRRYLRKKEPEAYLESKRQYWERTLKTLDIAVPDEVDVLDAGCGPAGIFMVLQGRKLVGIDPLLSAYTDLPHFHPDKYPWVVFQQQTIEELESTLAYDYIFCMNAINHVSDLNQSIERLQVAGRPGSWLIMTVDAHNYRLFRQVFSWLPGDILHPHQYYLQEYVEMLAQSGWQVERTQLLKRNFFFNYYGIVARK
jgi:2-polyprenyl-6-hydroxyphenyl methylase/3-demethylubiquinone-9 3-methyltransferase